MRQRAASTPGATLIKVIKIRQRAHRGTEAAIFDFFGGGFRGAWFWWTHDVDKGQIMAVAGGSGYGQMRGEPNVLYVPAGGIYDVLPAPIAARALRHQASQPNAKASAR
jgi:hypothetical protein